MSNSHFQPVSRRFAELANKNPTAQAEAFGKLVRAAGGRLEVAGLKAGIGARCQIDRKGTRPLNAGVIGFEGERLLLACEDATAGVVPDASVRVETISDEVPVGDALLGRIVDGAGRPLDGKPLVLEEGYPLRGKTLNPMDRSPISEPLDTGIRALNALLTVGIGQRIGFRHDLRHLGGIDSNACQSLIDYRVRRRGLLHLGGFGFRLLLRAFLRGFRRHCRSPCHQTLKLKISWSNLL